MFGKRPSSAQRLIAVFILTIFAPGILLAIFGAKALWQQKRTVDRQLQERLDQGAEVSIRILADEFAKLQSMVDEELPPEKIFRDLPADGSWAYVEGQSPNSMVYPRNILAYEIGFAAAPRLDPDLARAEELEVQEPNSPHTIATYRDLLRRVSPASIPEVKHRLARVLRTTGNEPEAERLWHDVEDEGGWIGSLPADLVAGFEIASVSPTAAQAFYRHLKEGRWRLEKARYLFYWTQIIERLGLTEEVGRNFRLAEAVEAATTSSSNLLGNTDESHLALRRETPFAALILSPEFLTLHVWPRIFTALKTDVSVSRVTANGRTVYVSSRATSPLLAMRIQDYSGISWRVEVAPNDAIGFYATVNRYSNFYLGMLALVVILLASGGYFTVRIVRRELEVARMKSEFVSTVSHEFRSPLTGIRQLGEMLARNRISDETKRHQYYELIVRESERLGRLVENILDFARMEEGRKQYRFESLNTAAWLESVVGEFQTDAFRSGHNVETNIPGDLPAVSGDREALSTALRNLLDNACKYSPDSKTVWLDAQEANGGIQVRVHDRGVGIPAGELRQIFEKFYRGGGEMTSRVKGAGLGLSLVQHIVDAHSGEVRVDSREGEGSTFSIHLRGCS